MNSPYLAGMRRLWLIPILGMFAPILGMPVLAYAIDAPPPCATVYVTHPLVTIQARAQKGNRIVPVAFEADGKVYHGTITMRLTKALPVFALDVPPDGWVYEEIRVSTSKETPPVVRDAQCVRVEWRK